MTLKINVPEPFLLKPKISIFGIGGAGGNALNNMIRSNLEGVEFIAANTDSQSLANSLAANRIQLGVNTTKGLGAGSFPDRGRAAAEENIDEIETEQLWKSIENEENFDETATIKEEKVPTNTANQAPLKLQDVNDKELDEMIDEMIQNTAVSVESHIPENEYQPYIVENQ